MGTGTCGLANGAGKIMKQIESYLAAENILAKVVEVGCVGYCQREVFVDLVMENGTRLSYCDLTPENAMNSWKKFLSARTTRTGSSWARSATAGAPWPTFPR